MKTRLKRFENDFTLLSSITVVSGGGQLTTPMTSFDVIGVGKGTVNEMLMSLPGIYGLAMHQQFKDEN